MYVPERDTMDCFLWDVSYIYTDKSEFWLLMFMALWQYFLIFWHSSVDFSSFDKILPTAVSLFAKNISQLSSELIVNAAFQFI